MYKHILIASDGSELAGKAFTHGLGLAKIAGARVTVVVVSEPMWSAVPGEMAIAMPQQDYEKATEARASKILAAASDQAEAQGVPYWGKHIKESFPDQGILAAAEEGECDLIVMASHGRRGLVRLFLGSIAQRVVTSSKIPVLIYREA